VAKQEQVASTATIKFDGAHGAPWYVAYGSPEEIKAELIDAFALDGASDAGLSLGEVIVEATRVAQATWRAASKLGGQIVGIENHRAPAQATNPMPATSPTGEAAWDAAAGAEPPFEPNVPSEPVDPLIAQIESARSMAEFASIWQANKDRFAEDAVKAAAAEAQKRLAA